MKLFNDINDLPKGLQGAALAIGNFDGVHLGHQQVIGAARAVGGKGTVGVMSFEPPPAAFFHPQKKHYRLTKPETKAQLVAELGVDFLLNLKFDAALASMPAEAFITDILQARLAVRHIVVGENFHFGKKRQGDVALLRAQSSAPVEIISSVGLDGAVVSSTHIRAALKAGSPQAAAKLLGRWFHLSGKVVEGKKLGRTLGFPTLNIDLTDYTDIAFGIYAVRVLIDGTWFDGVASLGVRPTIGDLNEPLLEVHLLNTEGDFYGTQADVFLLDFLRAEIKFDGLDSLKMQMAKDLTQATESLDKMPPFPFNTSNDLSL